MGITCVMGARTMQIVKKYGDTSSALRILFDTNRCFKTGKDSRVDRLDDA